MLNYNTEKIKLYIEKLEKLGVILSLEDVMGISWETSEEIGFVIDGEISIKKEVK
ncbi:hypothetical protein LCGC14_1038580 [marine sediment metagenome]|uniref:Uncharacterized protein n=1 Tax=marine sediment metagenome TaxID=412755 RepID=A0A0F9MX00_9ZZZZ